MKKKTKFIFGACLVLAAAAAVILAPKIKHYFFHKDYQEAMSGAVYEASGDSEFTPVKEEKTDVSGFVLASETNALKLYVNQENSQIAVFDKRSGKTFYSNPQQEDPIAAAVNAEELKSQLVIQYYNAKRTSMSMNNYSMSIVNGQFEIRAIDGGIRIIYTIGDLSSKTGTVPVYITEERLQTLVLDKLSEKDAKNVRSKYTDSKTYEGYLELASGVIKSKLTLRKFQAMFDEAGYTSQDFLEDMAIAEEGEEQVSFVIPVDYRLEGEEFAASIPTGRIQETGGAKIGTITLLKYFGCAGMEDEGYMLVPNGSGSLIYFNNGSKQEAYSQPVYGADPAAANYIVIEKTEKARLPVFGIKNGGSALFARITNGDSFASINADVAGKLNAQNFAYPSFTVRTSEVLSMFGTTGGQADLPLVEPDLADTLLCVRYAFLSGDEADYSGMANYYRESLIGEGVLGEKEETGPIPLYLDLVGGVQKTAFFIGVPYLTDYPMTTFEQAEEIAGHFQDEQITNLKLNYMGWFNGGYYHDMPDTIDILSRLGGKKGLKSLTAAVEKMGGEVFAEAAFQHVSEESGGFSPMFEAGKYYSGIYLQFGQVDPATVRQTSSLGYPETFYYCLSPRYLGYYAGKFADSMKKVPVTGISLRDLADSLQSDKKNTEIVNREAAKYIVQDAFETLKGSGKNILVSGGDSYAFAWADDIINAPIAQNPYFIVNEQIPFYEMVIHGYIEYAGNAINLNDFTEERLLTLNLIEAGAAVHFTLSYEDASEIKYSGLNSLYTTGYEYWTEDAVRIYKEINEALEKVSGCAMIRHEILSDTARKVTYDNGVSIYLNQSSAKAVIDGIEIDAYGWEVR